MADPQISYTRRRVSEARRDKLEATTHLHLLESVHALREVDLGRLREGVVEGCVVHLWKERVSDEPGESNPRPTQMTAAEKMGYVRKGGHWRRVKVLRKMVTMLQGCKF